MADAANPSVDAAAQPGTVPPPAPGGPTPVVPQASASPGAAGASAPPSSSPAPSSNPPASTAPAAAPAQPAAPALTAASSPSDQANKVFVGQIPQTCSEQDIRSIFSEYGQVLDVMFLVDKMTMMRKGCGFVTFQTEPQATAARLGLNGKITLPGAKRSIIVNPAGYNKGSAGGGGGAGVGAGGGGGEGQEFKVYVAMLSRSTTEPELQQLFAPYGNVIEVFIMKDPSGNSKGCAFIKYRSQRECDAAIAALNEQHTDKDAPSRMQVRMAATPKAKREQQMMSYGGAGMMMGGAGFMGGFPNMHMGGRMHGMHAGMGAMGPGGHMAGGWGAPVPGMGQYGHMQMPPGAPLYGASPAMGFPGAAPPGMPVMQQGMYGMAPQAAVGAAAAGAVGGGRQQNGPTGANLFVYGIPDTYGDSDLGALFSNFGNVISSKVQVEPASGRSKGFGFISFDDIYSAQSAINAMDGFLIGGKKLNVRVKKGDGGTGPPGRGGGMYGAAPPSVRYSPY